MHFIEYINSYSISNIGCFGYTNPVINLGSLIIYINLTTDSEFYHFMKVLSLFLISRLVHVRPNFNNYTVIYETVNTGYSVEIYFACFAHLASMLNLFALSLLNCI